MGENGAREPILIPAKPMHGAHSRGGHRYSPRLNGAAVLNHTVPFNPKNWDRYKGVPASSAIEELRARLDGKNGSGVSRQDVFDCFFKSPKLGIVAAIVWGYPKGNLPGGRPFDPIFLRIDEIEQSLAAYCDAPLSAEHIYHSFDKFKYLGPSTFTKLLYFSGVHALEGPCLIYDQMVMRSVASSTEPKWQRLRSVLGPVMKCGSYTTFPKEKQIATYGEYLRTALSLAGRVGDPAAIEMELFINAPKGRRTTDSSRC